MACWSAENATKAYIRTLKMVSETNPSILLQRKRVKEPDVAEFLSALAAGNSAQLIVEVCAGIASATTLALVAAAHQTGGRVVCILRGLDKLQLSEEALGHDADCVEFVIGDAQTLLLNDYRGADFVLIDCNIENHQGIFQAVQVSAKHRGAVVVGYNAFSKESWWRSGTKTQLLPIGDGLLVTRIPATAKVVVVGGGGGGARSRWVVQVDKYTGEEHVFRLRSKKREETQN